ncbi:IPT/TIG domain-containing protein [Flammeovirga sp. EKP202]|uniref:IPT/TIG domain-containing protein n=1 Tax=Flammeovirga sp. EKP202 TaxID=2770592 RepID=UPI00165F8EE3|nr:IPT/TIG domain-containing protein [Flammeovirga sp. EKP202]MBD0404907.1 IPT/TIG domain-containing protein [Flammeovirga sp. EKP202]
MKYLIKITLFTLLSILLMNCYEEEVSSRNYPRVKTLPVANITSSGATFKAEIIYRGGFDILNYGFVWSENENLTVENSNRVIYSENITSEHFSKVMNSSLEKDVFYFVRAFVETKDFIVYGEVVDFLSLGSNGPELIAFSPESGDLGDTISIEAQSFGRFENNIEVKIDNHKAKILDFQETELLVEVPQGLSTEFSNISVSSYGNVSTFEKQFKLTKPVVNNLSTTHLSFNEVFHIEGQHFTTKPNKVVAKFLAANGDVFISEIIAITEHQITTKVPDNVNAKEVEVVVVMNNFEVAAPEMINIKDPVFHSLSKESGKTLGRLTIKGENFSPISTNNHIEIDGYTAEIVKASNNEIIVIIPDPNLNHYSNRNVEVAIHVLDTETQSKGQFYITDKWFRLEDAPVKNTYRPVLIKTEGKVYVGLNSTSEFWSVNTTTLEWERLADFPGEDRDDGAGFYLDGEIYFGTGVVRPSNNVSDFWKYTIATNSWTQLNDFIGPERTKAVGFSIGSKGYISSGHQSSPGIYHHPYGDCWEYNPSTDTWIEIPSYGDLGELSGIDGYAHAGAVVINDVAYLGMGWNYHGCCGPDPERDSFLFQPHQGNKWTKLPQFPESRESRPLVFELNGQPYFYINENFYKYQGYWQYVETNFSTKLRNGIAFSNQQKGYVALGGGNAIWEFDPSQPD